MEVQVQTQELLEKLVSINSVYPGEREIAEFIEECLENLGFEVERIRVSAKRFNVLAGKGHGDKALLLYGHMDTVPRVEGWDSDPWKPRVEGDQLYGLGSYDMKAGLCAILQAVRDFAPEGYKLKLAFLVDEENIAEGAYTLVESPWVMDVVAAMTPESGTSSVQRRKLGPRLLTLGRRGRIDLDGLYTRGWPGQQHRAIFDRGPRTAGRHG